MTSRSTLPRDAMHECALDRESLGKAHDLIGDVLRRGEGEVGPRSGLVEVQRGDDAEAELAGKLGRLSGLRRARHRRSWRRRAGRRGPPGPGCRRGARTGRQTAVSAATSCGPSRTATVRALIAGSSCTCSCRRAEQLAAVRRRLDLVDLAVPAVAGDAGDLGDRERAGGLRAPGGQPKLGAGAAQFSGQVLSRAGVEPVAEVVGHDDRVRSAGGDHRLGGGEHRAGGGAVAPQRQVRARPRPSAGSAGGRAAGQRPCRPRHGTAPGPRRGRLTAMARVGRTGSRISARACRTPSVPLSPSVAESTAASRASRVVPRSPPAPTSRRAELARPAVGSAACPG